MHLICGQQCCHMYAFGLKGTLFNSATASSSWPFQPSSSIKHSQFILISYDLFQLFSDHPE